MGDHIKDLTEGVEEGTVWDGGGHRYHLEKVVGNGAFGIVWRARSEDGEVVAIKKVMLDRRYHNRELQMMKVMEHENVVRLRHYFEKAGRKKDETFLHLVMDYLPETIRSVALKHHKRARRFHVDHIKAYLCQTFRALEYIHARRICHRDIKPDNLLCDPATLKCRLCDFGCSKVLVKGQPNVSYICSRYYRAPELMFGATEYSVSVDVWSVGTILMELLLSHLPFQGQDSTQQHLVEIMKLIGTPTDRDLQAMRATCVADDLPKLKPYPWERIFPSNTPPEATDLAQRLLRYDPDERLTASQALAHPLFDGIDQLVEGSSSSTSLPPPSEALTPAHRPAMTPADWERRICAHFDDVRGGLPLGQLGDTMARHLDATLQQGIGEATAQQLTGVVRQDLAACLRARDDTMQGLQARLADEARKHQLPCESEGGAANGASGGGGNNAASANGGSSAAGGGAGEAEALRAQLEELKQAQRSLEQANAEKADLAARIKLAQRRLEGGAKAAEGEPGAVDRASSAEGLAGGDGDKPAPGFGRRAGGPTMPTRMASGVVGDSPMLQKGDAAARGLQPDNMGQVTPLGFSPAVEQQRPTSSGRRRSKLAEEGGSANGSVEPSDGADNN